MTWVLVTSPIGWDVMVVDWIEGVGAIDMLLLRLACIGPNFLAEMAKFIGILGCAPGLFVG
jgi:hypothetical protein